MIRHERLTLVTREVFLQSTCTPAMPPWVRARSGNAFQFLEDSRLRLLTDDMRVVLGGIPSGGENTIVKDLLHLKSKTDLKALEETGEFTTRFAHMHPVHPQQQTHDYVVYWGCHKSSLDSYVAEPIQTQYVVANPAPLGWWDFVRSTFVLSLHKAGLMIPQSAPLTVFIGVAAGYGGLAQLLAGMCGRCQLETLSDLQLLAPTQQSGFAVI